MSSSSTLIGDRYRPIILLGEGATATVRLAVAEGPSGFNKLVVLKALKPDLVEDDDFRTMFLTEARLSAQLRHRNIVEVLEIVEEDRTPVIVMPYLEGQELDAVVTRGHGRMSLALRMEICVEALRGLHHSHELKDFDGVPLGVIHRDATPQNVFITYDGEVKLLDFGIAKLGAAPGHTQTGVLKGKIRYMPPEQILGEELDRRVDVFAVGVMAWELVAGRPMWPDDVGEASILEALVNEEIPRLRDAAPDAPEELLAVIDRALAGDREDRYATAEAFADDLEQVVKTVLPGAAGLRDAGRLAAELFAEEREGVRQAVEDQLAGSATLTGAHLSIAPSRGNDGPRPLPFVALAAAVAALVAALALLLWPGVLNQGEPPAGRDVASVDSAPKPVDRVPVHVTAFPLNARLTVNGLPTSSNRFVARLPASNTEHTIVATLEGYQTVRRTFVVDGPIDVVITLEKAPVPAPKAPPAAPSPAPLPVRPPPAPVAPKPSPKPSCDPPYYFVDGVKKYRRECL